MSTILEMIRSELERIGTSLDDIPTLALPAEISIEEFVVRLAEIPSGAGASAVEELLASFHPPQRAPWHIWPDPLGTFTSEERNRAWALVNVGPEPAQPFITTDLLILLSLLSPELSRRVDRFRAEVQAKRKAAGMSIEVIETAEVRWRERRARLAKAVSNMST
jgi:hypothetical protein